MADAKISALTSASTPLAGTEVLPIVQNNTTVKVAVSNLTAGRTVYTAAVAGNLAAGTSFAPKNVGFITPDSSAYANPSVWNGDIENVATFGLINLNSGSLTASKYQAGVVGIARVNGSGTPGASNAVFGVLGTTSNAYGLDVKDYAIGAIGKAYVSDNVVIGTAGKGIDFSANTHAAGMTSELLNWYEEGTWTPIDNSGAGLTLTNEATATYTRVGRMVTAHFWVKYPVTASGAGMAISGVPFVAASGVSGSVIINQTEYTTPFTGQTQQGTSQMVFFTFGNTQITNANMSDLRVRGTTVYFV